MRINLCVPLVLLTALMFVGQTVPVRADTPADCQKRSLKKLNDPQAGLVNLTPVATSIRHLVSLRVRPSAGHARGWFEKRTFRLHATIVFVKWEHDHDLHVVLSDGRRTMITEAPAPACSPGSRVLKQIRKVRAALHARFPRAGPGNKGLQVSVRATVTGVGFFDDVHGQFGVAPNGVELHPLLSIRFG